MARPKKENPKTEKVRVACSKDEKREIELKAKAYNMSVSQYLRQLGLGYPIKSKVDQMTLVQLANLQADLGRLGGLFKMWLVKNQDHKLTASIGDRQYFTIDQLVDDIEDKQEEIQRIGKKLLDTLG